MLVEITRENDHPPPSIIAASPEIREEYAAKCQRCGLCCRHPLIKADGPITANSDLTYQATERIIYRWWHGYEQTDEETGYWMRRTFRKKSRCIALSGTLGRNVTCSIYDDRPSACRSFEPGSDACIRLRERAHKNLNHESLL